MFKLKEILSTVEHHLHAATGIQDSLMIQIDITNACNLSCSHCYHENHENNGAIALGDWLQILDQYEHLCKKLRRNADLVICGGEPLLSPLFFPVLEHIRSRWPKAPITILTNGTLLRNTVVQTLKNFGTRIQVSLDGPDEHSHNKLRGLQSFERALRGIRLLRENQIKVSALAVLSQQSAPDISKFFDLAAKLQLHSMNFTRLIAEGAAKGSLAQGFYKPLAGKELKEALEAILVHSKRTGVATNTDQALFHLLDPKLGAYHFFGYQGLVIDYKGQLKVSSRTPTILGKVLEEGLETLFMKHPTLVRLRRGDIAICGSCRYRARCGGNRNAAFSEYQSYFSPDPGCWII